MACKRDTLWRMPAEGNLMAHASWLAAVMLLNAVGACGQRVQEIADLDLGGGISMTADGEIKGATKPWASSVPAEEDDESLSRGR